MQANVPTNTQLHARSSSSEMGNAFGKAETPRTCFFCHPHYQLVVEATFQWETMTTALIPCDLPTKNARKSLPSVSAALRRRRSSSCGAETFRINKNVVVGKK